jgi:protein-disulfide isomerase-like protein with CxxC motif
VDEPDNYVPKVHQPAHDTGQPKSDAKDEDVKRKERAHLETVSAIVKLLAASLVVPLKLKAVLNLVKGRAVTRCRS